MSKRGISTIVATVLVILITVAAVAIIWVAIIPMIQNNIAFSEFDSMVYVPTSGGYTAYDSSTNLTSVQVVRNAGDADIEFIQVIFSFSGKSITSVVPAPGPNQAKTYLFNFTDYPAPDYVSVAPIYIVGGQEKLGSISSTVKVPVGNVDGNPVYELEGSCVNNEVRECGNECQNFTKTCSDGVWGACTFIENYSSGTGCSGGTCQGGVCVECINDATQDCVGANECKIYNKTCGGGVWGSCDIVGDKVYGTSCDSGLGQCDGAGSCVEIETYFNSVGDFSNVSQGNRGWYYQTYYGGSYSNISNYDGSFNAWSQSYVLVSNNWTHPGTSYDAVQTWVSDHTGTINITSEIIGPPACSAGIVFLIYKNSEYLDSLSYAPGTSGVVSLQTTVVVGDSIHFRVNNGGHNACDSTGTDHTIRVLL